MPIEKHPVFERPLITTNLWRYVDISKFLDLLTSKKLWLSNLEALAKSDPYEGNPGAVQFPHRIWNNIDEVPQELKRQIIEIYGDGSPKSHEDSFHQWFMLQEQEHILRSSWRRQYFINCWHASNHESAAMWKIYGSPGFGVAIISNGARIESSLHSVDKKLYLGKVKYEDPNVVEFGSKNAFQSVIVKRSNYQYEQEVRLVYYNTEDIHNPLEDFSWNRKRMRFDNIKEDIRPVTPGFSLSCNLDVLIEAVVISPEAPSWYLPMIENLRDSLGFGFKVYSSQLLVAAQIPP